MIQLVMINQLAAKVGAPSYQKTPIFHKKRTSATPTYENDTITAADWEEMRNFKSTNIR